MNTQFINNLQTTHILYMYSCLQIFHNKNFKCIFKKQILPHWAKHYNLTICLIQRMQLRQNNIERLKMKGWQSYVRQTQKRDAQQC